MNTGLQRATHISQVDLEVHLISEAEDRTVIKTVTLASLENLSGSSPQVYILASVILKLPGTLIFSNRKNKTNG